MALSEVQSNIIVTGILKTLSIEPKVTKKGAEALGGYVVVEVTDTQKNVVNNIRMNVWVNKITKAGAISKMYTSLLTVMKEYKTKDEHKDDADLVSISGRIDINDYMSDQGMKSNLRLTAQFFNRVDDKTTPQQAMMSAKLAVVNYTPVMDAEGAPIEPATDRVESYLVGYNNKIIPMELMIHDDGMGLLDNFKALYMPNSTGTLTIKINNYPDTTDEQPEPEIPAGGFGQMMEPKTFTKFVSEYEIVGGQAPLEDGLGYTLEDITEIKKLRTQQLAVIQQQAEQEPQVSMPTNMATGFSAPAMPPANEATPNNNTAVQNGGIPNF